MMLLVLATFATVAMGWIEHSCGPKMGDAYFDAGQTPWVPFTTGSQVMSIPGGYTWARGCSLCAEHVRDLWAANHQDVLHRQCFFCVKDLDGVFLYAGLDYKKKGALTESVRCAQPSVDNNCWGPLCARATQDAPADNMKPVYFAVGAALVFAVVAAIVVVRRKRKLDVLGATEAGDQAVLLA